MDTDTVGKLCALATALSWAGAIVLFRRGTDHVHPIALNLFKNCIGLVGVVGTLAALWLWRGELPAWPVSLDAEDRRLWILLLSGVGGIAVGDSLVFRGLKLAGVGPVAVVDCLYSPAVVLCSWLMLAEVITAAHLVGGAMIVGAVAVLTLRDRQQDVHRAGLVKGCLYAAAGVLLMAFCIVWAQPELKGLRAELGDTQGILAGTLVRLAGGTAALVLVGGWWPGAAEIRKAFTPGKAWRITVPGAILGAYVSMVMWIAGFALTDAASAGLINQSATVFSVLMAALFLKERITRTRLVCVVLAMLGIGVVMLGDQAWAWLRSLAPGVGYP